MIFFFMKVKLIFVTSHFECFVFWWPLNFVGLVQRNTPDWYNFITYIFICLDVYANKQLFIHITMGEFTAWT